MNGLGIFAAIIVVFVLSNLGSLIRIQRLRNRQSKRLNEVINQFDNIQNNSNSAPAEFKLHQQLEEQEEKQTTSHTPPLKNNLIKYRPDKQVLEVNVMTSANNWAAPLMMTKNGDYFELQLQAPAEYKLVVDGLQVIDGSAKIAQNRNRVTFACQYFTGSNLLSISTIF